MQNPDPAGPAIRSEFADDPDMLELVEEFVAELPGRVSALREAFERGETESLTRMAHQLSGASGGYGFACVGDQARELEMRLKSIDGDCGLQSLADQVDALVSMCSRVVV